MVYCKLDYKIIFKGTKIKCSLLSNTDQFYDEKSQIFWVLYTIVYTGIIRMVTEKKIQTKQICNFSLSNCCGFIYSYAYKFYSFRNTQQN